MYMPVLYLKITVLCHPRGAKILYNKEFYRTKYIDFYSSQ